MLIFRGVQVLRSHRNPWDHHAAVHFTKSPLIQTAGFPGWWFQDLQGSYNTPLEHTPGHQASQLWKDSLYSLLGQVKGCVPKVCWNNLRRSQRFGKPLGGQVWRRCFFLKKAGGVSSLFRFVAPATNLPKKNPCRQDNWKRHVELHLGEISKEPRKLLFLREKSLGVTNLWKTFRNTSDKICFIQAHTFLFFPCAKKHSEHNL